MNLAYMGTIGRVDHGVFATTTVDISAESFSLGYM